jgi:Vacuolar protein sorting-associated protein 62
VGVKGALILAPLLTPPLPLLLLVLVIVAVHSFERGLHSTGSALPDPERGQVKVDPDDQERLAEYYRPILYFDSGEHWRPLNVDRFLDHPGADPNRVCHRGEKRPGTCPVISDHHAFDPEQPPRGSDDRFLNLGGSAPNGADFEGPRADCPARAPPLRDCDAGPGSAIYYEVKQANGRFYVDYWWFFRYNDFPGGGAFTSCTGVFTAGCGDHEGDWEGVTVVTAADDSGQIEYVTYAEHSGDFRYSPSQIQFGGLRDSRPYVYVAQGTHASYPAACAGNGCTQLLPLSLGHRRPEGRHDGGAKWGRNTGEDCSAGDTACVLPLPAADRSWDGYHGLWGLVCKLGRGCPVNAGPKTPSDQDRYLYPWCYQRVLPSGNDFERASSCDRAAQVADPAAAPGTATQTDCRAWAGSNVAILGCDEQALATTLSKASNADSSDIQILVAKDTDHDPSTPPRIRVIGRTATRGVSQVVDKVLRAPYFFIVRGKVSEVIARGRGPDGTVLEAKFAQIKAAPGEQRAFYLKQSDGQLSIFMRKPNGRFREPSTLTRLG